MVILAETMLAEAATSSLTEVKRILRATRCNINGENTSVSPLYMASIHGRSYIVKFLIERGADVNHHIQNGTTALHGACYNGEYEVAKCLIEHGAFVNSRDSTKSTLDTCCSRRSL